jgi:hypothetical protein
MYFYTFIGVYKSLFSEQNLKKNLKFKFKSNDFGGLLIVEFEIVKIETLNRCLP